MDSISDTKMQSTHEASPEQAATDRAPAKRTINSHFTELNVMRRMPNLSAVRHLIEDEDKLSKTEIAGIYMNEQPISKLPFLEQLHFEVETDQVPDQQ